MTSMVIILLMLPSILSGVNALTNGRIANRHDFPYIAVVCEEDFFLSPGIILDSNRILIRALYVLGSISHELLVRVDNLEFRPCYGSGIPVESYRIHHGHDDSIHDLAVIKIAQSLAWTPLVQPITIGVPPTDICTTCRMTGWIFGEAGDLPILGWSPAYVYPSHRCSDFGINIGETELCMANPTSESSVKDFDEGYPVVCDGFLVGLLVGLEDSDAPRRPTDVSVIVDLSFYRDWIYEAD